MSAGGGGVVNGGPFGGVPVPLKMPGRYFLPPHFFQMDTSFTVALTAARYYFVPMYVDGRTTFAGAWCQNTGVGDSGKNLKMAAFAEAAAGGPGALAKSFGAVALNAAASTRSFAAAWTPAAGWYYVAVTSDSTPTMQGMATSWNVTNAGLVPSNPLAELLGTLGPVSSSGSPAGLFPGMDFVAGVYANFPEANALTPTGGILGNVAQPLMGLYT